MMPLDVVCFKWVSTNYKRKRFGPETVNTLKRMVQRHYQKPHRFTCITDDATGIDADVRIIPLWNDHSAVPSPFGLKNPSCYRRLKLFSMEAADIIGPRFIAIDLDSVITADVSPIFDRPEDFVCWGDTNPQPGSHYNGSLMLLTAGARRKVWETFNPQISPRQSKAAGCWGSDQGWISYCLGPGEKKWTRADGVFSFRNEVQKMRTLPPDARMVMFHGQFSPWGEDVRAQHPWITEHYR